MSNLFSFRNEPAEGVAGVLAPGLPYPPGSICRMTPPNSDLFKKKSGLSSIRIMDRPWNHPVKNFEKQVFLSSLPSSLIPYSPLSLYSPRISFSPLRLLSVSPPPRGEGGRKTQTWIYMRDLITSIMAF